MEGLGVLVIILDGYFSHENNIIKYYLIYRYVADITMSTLKQCTINFNIECCYMSHKIGINVE